MAAILLSSTSPSKAGGPGTTSADLLLESFDPRVLSVGRAVAGLPRDFGSAELNPAALSGVQSGEVSFIHQISWFGTGLDRFSYLRPQAKTGSWGFRFVRRGLPRVDNDVADPEADPPLEAWDSALSIDWGQPGSRNQRLGLGLTGGISKIGTVYAGWGALAAGIQRDFSRGLTLGVALRNLGLGPTFGGDKIPLPLHALAGASKALSLGSTQKITLMASSGWQQGAGAWGGLGVEWSRRGAFRIGGGWRFASEEWLASGPSLGLSLERVLPSFRISLDYAWKPQSPGLGRFHYNHQFGFKLILEKNKPAAPAPSQEPAVPAPAAAAASPPAADPPPAAPPPAADPAAPATSAAPTSEKPPEIVPAR